MRVEIRSWKEWNNTSYSDQDISLTGQTFFVTMLSMLSGKVPILADLAASPKGTAERSTW